MGRIAPPAFFPELLKDAENKWIAFRDAECKSSSYAYYFGNHAECVDAALCAALLTKHRIDELKANYP